MGHAEHGETSGGVGSGRGFHGVNAVYESVTSVIDTFGEVWDYRTSAIAGGVRWLRGRAGWEPVGWPGARVWRGP
jgi:hypothetical protein